MNTLTTFEARYLVPLGWLLLLALAWAANRIYQTYVECWKAVGER